MKNILACLASYEVSLHCADHRYGCGYTAALLPSWDAAGLFCDLTDASGSSPFILQPILSHPLFPVFVARGNSAEAALQALEQKLSAMSEEERYEALELTDAIGQGNKEDHEFLLCKMPELHALPWYKSLAAEYDGWGEYFFPADGMKGGAK